MILLQMDECCMLERPRVFHVTATWGRSSLSGRRANFLVSLMPLPNASEQLRLRLDMGEQDHVCGADQEVIEALPKLNFDCAELLGCMVQCACNHVILP